MQFKNKQTHILIAHNCILFIDFFKANIVGKKSEQFTHVVDPNLNEVVRQGRDEVGTTTDPHHTQEQECGEGTTTTHIIITHGERSTD